MAPTATTTLTAQPTSLISRDDPKYEEARVGRVFNRRRPDRYPHAVVEATCIEDVVEAVKLAKEMNLRVSVRSGGHSWAAWSVRDDAILIDLGNLRRVELDEYANVAKASPSTTGRVLNKFLATKGKMFGGGHCPDVALGGFLLQGGMGWNCAVRLPPKIWFACCAC
jgi:FAD/FMN-containing dehydrogenase